MNVIFVAPDFPSSQRQYVRALRGQGANVWGVGDRPLEWMDAELRGWMTHYEHVPSLADQGALYNAVRRMQGMAWIDRMECTVETLMLPAAKAREACKIPGLSSNTVLLCRDKHLMKAHLRAAGIPLAADGEVNSAKDALEFGKAHGFPFILKPRAGAGASGTTRVDRAEEVESVCRSLGVEQGRGVMAEEFLTGHEGFYDTLTARGIVVFESIAHYYPNVLEAMRTRWISPQIAVTNRLWAKGYEELRELGKRVIKALDLSTTATHMEWFYGPQGLKFSEIACRPPGCNLWDMYCHINEFDIYSDWARAVMHGATDPAPSRRFAGGLISLRPSQDGTITGYSGLDDVKWRCGEWIYHLHLPAIGSSTAPVEAGYIAHGYALVRHPDYDELRRMMTYIGENLKIWAR